MMSRVHRQDYEMARVEKTVKILVCNAGSSRLKFSHFEALLAEGGIDWTTEPTLLLRCRRQWEIRADRELPNLSFPALELDQKRILQPDVDIATPDAASRILVVGMREDSTVIRETSQDLLRR